jgi:hypothetical protein
MSEYPATCLRGLRKADWIEDNIIQTPAFLPDKRSSETREDGGQETSINWEDDTGVVLFTLSNEATARHGAARISLEGIRATSDQTAPVKNPLLWERKPISGNDHHGNIVFKAEVNKRLTVMLAASLATKSTFVPPPS